MKYYSGKGKMMDYGAVNAATEQAFREDSMGNVRLLPENPIPFHGIRFLTKPVYLPGMDIAGVRIARAPDGGTSPDLHGTVEHILIVDPRTGSPIALMDATRFAVIQSGAAGALAAKFLCPKKEIVLGLIGAGRRAEYQFKALAEEFSITSVKIWSANETQVGIFRKKYPAYEITMCNPKRTCDCDVLVTTTPSCIPVVRNKWIMDGTHINAMGADTPGRQELDPCLLIRGRVFVDDISRAVRAGEINVPISKGYFAEHRIAGTLGELILKRKARRTDDEITIFNATGLAILDLAIASVVMKYCRAIEIPDPA